MQNHRGRAAAIAGVLAATAGVSFGQFGGWGAVQTRPANAPRGPAIGVGDFDGDGFEDFSYVGGFGDLYVVFGDETAGISSADTEVDIPPEINVDGSQQFHRIQVSDFDGDGFDDIAVPGTRISSGQSRGTSWFVAYGSSDRLFSSTAVLEAAVASQNNAGGSLGNVAADIDGDGDIDLLVVSELTSDQGKVYLLRNEGARSFSMAGPVTPSANAQFRDLAVGDLDGNGVPELLTQSGSNLRIMRDQDGDGVWESFLNLSEPATLSSIVVSDATGDGVPDILGIVTPALRLWANEGTLTFSLTTTLIPGLASTTELRSSFLDLDGDGDLDLLGTRGSTPTTSVAVLNDGFGNFSIGPSVQGTNVNGSVAVIVGAVDIDNNGSPDYLNSQANSNRFSYALNLTDVLPPGPFDLVFPSDDVQNAPIPEDLVWPGLSVRFNWERPTGFTVGYTFTISENQDLSSPRYQVSTAQTGLTLPVGALDRGKRYYWSVEATTQAGQTLAANGPRTFTTRCPADANGDQFINFADVAAFITQFQTGCP